MASEGLKPGRSRLEQLGRLRREKAAKLMSAQAEISRLETAEHSAAQEFLRESPTASPYQLGSPPQRLREKRQRLERLADGLERDIAARDAALAALKTEIDRERLLELIRQAKALSRREDELRAGVVESVLTAWREIIDGIAQRDESLVKARSEGLLAADRELAAELEAVTLPSEPAAMRPRVFAEQLGRLMTDERTGVSLSGRVPKVDFEPVITRRGELPLHSHTRPTSVKDSVIRRLNQGSSWPLPR